MLRTSLSYQICESARATSGVQAFRLAFAMWAATESGITFPRVASSWMKARPYARVPHSSMSRSSASMSAGVRPQG